MQNYLFIGGDIDSLSAPLPDEPESIKLPDSVLNKVVYVRAKLTGPTDQLFTFITHLSMEENL